MAANIIEPVKRLTEGWKAGVRYLADIGNSIFAGTYRQVLWPFSFLSSQYEEHFLSGYKHSESKVEQIHLAYIKFGDFLH
jgi:hypothetical protein